MHPDKMSTPEGSGRPAPIKRMLSTIRRARAGRRWGRVADVELWQRSLGFAALGFLTLVPLLIVVSAADAAGGRGFAQWLGDGLGVSAAARQEIERLFTLPGQVLRTTTAFGLAVLAVFGLSFGTLLQSGYEKIWDLPPARWWARWRHVVWLTGLVGVLYLSAITPLWRANPARGLVTVLGGTLFFWWSQRLLLGGRIAWTALLPGAVSTMLGLLGLRVFSRLVFSPLIASSAITYGAFGTVLVLQSWLVGVGVVVFGGALTGRLIDDELPRVTRALKPPNRRELRGRAHALDPRAGAGAVLRTPRQVGERAAVEAGRQVGRVPVHGSRPRTLEVPPRDSATEQAYATDSGPDAGFHVPRGDADEDGLRSTRPGEFEAADHRIRRRFPLVDVVGARGGGNGLVSADGLAQRAELTAARGGDQDDPPARPSSSRSSASAQPRRGNRSKYVP